MPHLWLCPSPRANLNATILNPVPFERLDILMPIDASIPERYRALYAEGAQGFHCWAIGGDHRARGFFSTCMNPGSVCLFSEPSSGVFHLAARVLGRVDPCECAKPNSTRCARRVDGRPDGPCVRRASTIQLARELWPADVEKPSPWELLFFTTPATSVSIPKQQLVESVGWSSNYGVPFTRPIKDVNKPRRLRHTELLGRIGDLDTLWNDILRNNPIDYLYANG